MPPLNKQMNVMNINTLPNLSHEEEVENTYFYRLEYERNIATDFKDV